MQSNSKGITTFASVDDFNFKNTFIHIDCSYKSFSTTLITCFDTDIACRRLHKRLIRFTILLCLKKLHRGLPLQELTRLGVTLVGHQKKIMNSVQTLRAQLCGAQVAEGFLV